MKHFLWNIVIDLDFLQVHIEKTGIRMFTQGKYIVQKVIWTKFIAQKEIQIPRRVCTSIDVAQ